MKASTVGFTALVATWALPAVAARAPDQLHGVYGLETFSGETLETRASLAYEVPFTQAEAFRALTEDLGAGWRGAFDARTGVPSRLYGGSVPVAGAVASAARAEAHARSVLARHVAFLAPGAAAEDFALAANDLTRGLRTVAFVQTHGGLPVVSGQLSFRYKADRLFMIASDALPHVRSERPARLVDSNTAEARATAWIARDFGPSARASEVRGPFVLALPSKAGLEYRTVFTVRVDTTAPILRFATYLDAGTGEPLARRQTLLFADGTLRINAPERWPGGTRNDVPAAGMNATVNGAQVTSDAAGLVSWSGTDPAPVTLRASGPLFRVDNQAGADLTGSATLQPGGDYVWNQSASEQGDAQLITFVSAQIVKARTKLIAPTMTWLDQQAVANVNFNDTCNAFSDGETINFFSSSRQCENTGRLPDVIYHEFGHSFHAHAIIPGAGDFDGELSEGVSDYLAATITGDPGMGRGFFFTNDALRHIDPAGSEARWPEDRAQDPHETGLIIAGALWDLRKSLVASMGTAQGVAKTDELMYLMIQRARDIPTTYAEILAADDDDGNLGNGTPNVCAINDAFARHGLADPGTSGPGLGLPELTGLRVSLQAPGSQMACPGAEVQSVSLSWRLRRDPQSAGQLPMALAGGVYSAELPRPGDGEVVQYQVQATLSGGDVRTYPENPADPWYETYVGDVTPIYCTDFERDPGPEGWAHMLVAGSASQGADDWTWGTPAGTTGSGDPAAAFSGNRVYGNDLGGGNFNGKYQANKTNALIGPTVDVRAFSVVRLQYRRWLTVEDGFFDKARVQANGQTLWANLATNAQGSTAHEDKEWRFHDVDLSGAVRDGTVQVRFELESDGGLEFGGWTIDDFCIVGAAPAAAPVCGNGRLEMGEACDDGNTVNGDGCEASCVLTPAGPMCGNGQLEAGEACDDGNAVGGDGCEQNCTVTPAAPVCGNGRVEAGEACDDGNAQSGDGCEAGCTLTPGTQPNNPAEPRTLDTDRGGCSCRTGSEGGLEGAALALGLLYVLARSRRRR